MMRPIRDDGVSSVVGAIVVLAILSSAIIYVNAFHVPREGASLEVAARERAEASLVETASDLAQGRPMLADLVLRPAASPPALLGGIILDPVRAEGRAAFAPAETNVTISVVMDAPAAGVPADDPTRVAISGGLMRVYLWGNATAGAPVGSLHLAVGGAYLDEATYRIEAGAVILSRPETSATIAAPPLQVQRAGTLNAPVTAVSWTLPVLTGSAAELAGGNAVQASLAPGPLVTVGGAPRLNAPITVQTTARAAWESALEEIAGTSGTVTSTSTGADAGNVTVTFERPSGLAVTARAVTLDLTLVAYDLALSARSGG
jgi:hypothetical protein